MNTKKRVLAGMRASGRLHLGNYLGGIKGMLALQDDDSYETLYMIADVHGITTPYNPKVLTQNRREVLLDYLAAGLDPEKSVVFFQSMVPQHLELTFYLSSVITVARMQHLPTFKEKVKQYPEHVTMALLNYPVLMAADILVYKAQKVPVGIDQEPHLEIAREIARKMNDLYDLDFAEPTRFATKGEYVPSITGQGKMSKSVEGSYILLTDDLETVKARLSKVPTDSGKGTIERNLNEDTAKISEKINSQFMSKDSSSYFDATTKEPSFGVLSLMRLVELIYEEKGKQGHKKGLGKIKREEYESQYDVFRGGKGLRYKDLKDELAIAIDAVLKPMQEKRKELEADPHYIDTVIEEGAAKASSIAEKTITQVKEKMGL